MHKRHDTYRDKSRSSSAKLAAIARKAARRAKGYRVTICIATGKGV